ncbi:MAG TPA: A24 family peptidase [Nocardioidaceae bacterium]|nr:A24 family peptidase [Nocardioidaceae bacterium]
MSADTWSLAAGLVMAAVGAVLGWFVPALIARIPEPEAEPGPPFREVGSAGEPELPATEREAAASGAEPVAGLEEPKERYDAIAALPGLAWKSAVASGVTSGLVGAVVGWGPILLLWAYLVPVGVALAIVDWRTRLLPTKVIAPSYVVLVVLTVLAAVLAGDWDSLIRAGWGWLVAGGTFFVLWFIYPRGMGYGDVRLSGLLGIALGYLGWGELLTGVYAGFLIGGIGGLLLSVLRIVDRKAYPFGPFMLVGALVGVLAGPGVAAWYA